jgi:hypothetical protein
MILWVREGVQGCRSGLFRLANRGSNGRFRSGEDARRCSSLVTRIRRPRWLNQQDMHFPARHGAVLDAGRHYKNFAGIEGDGAIPQLDVERSFKDKKKTVCLVMFVPVQRPLKFGYHYVVVVVSRNCAWGETVGERRQLFAEICRCFHCVPLAEGFLVVNRCGSSTRTGLTKDTLVLLLNLQQLKASSHRVIMPCAKALASPPMHFFGLGRERIRDAEITA